MQSPTGTLSQRYLELDALRGLAAMVVVFRHFVNLWPKDGGGMFLLIAFRSPIRLLIAAHEAVLLFFLLSGFVLTMPFLRTEVPYALFVVRRMFRIYLPYLVALGVAVLGAMLLPREIVGLSWWYSFTWSRPVSLSLVMQHVIFLGNYDFAQFNTAFWSLVYEMRISLVFPVIFALSRYRARYVIAVALFLSCCSFLLKSTLHSAEWAITLHYAGVFIVGSLLARQLPSIRLFYARQSQTAISCLTIAALALVTWRLGPSPDHRFYPLFEWLNVSGAAWILITSLCSVSFRSFLHSVVPQFLGRVSYSLYLVHGTILFALVRCLYGRVPLMAIFPVYLTCALGIATIFHYAVEAPCMRLGQRICGSKRKLRYEPLEAPQPS